MGVSQSIEIIFGVLVGLASKVYKPGAVAAQGGQFSPQKYSYKHVRLDCAVMFPKKTRPRKNSNFLMNRFFI